MESPQFPMYSPKSAPDDGEADFTPVPGAARGDDPGFWASLRTGTVLGRLRATTLALMAAPPLIAAIVPLIVRDGRGRLGDAPPWLFLPLVAAAALALLVGPRLPRALRPGAGPGTAAWTSLTHFRQALLLRFALAESAVLLGVPLAMVGRSEWVFAAGFALGYPLMLWLALPTTGTVEAVRRRLEADGAESHLWAALLAPAPGRPSR